MDDEELRSSLADVMSAAKRRGIPDVGVLRRRARSRLLRRVAAACTVTVVIVAIGLGVNAGLQGGGHAGHPRHSGGPAATSGTGTQSTWYPGRWFPALRLPAADAGPSVAPYLVEISSPTSTYVASVASGAQVAQVSEPANVSYFGVAAAGDDHTFLLASMVGKAIQFYEVRVGPGSLPGLPVLVLSVPAKSMVPASTAVIIDFAISPDASMLAYSTLTGFEVVSLATGQATSWPAAGGYAGSFSWAGNDRTLAFDWSSKSDPAQSGLRLLDTWATGSLPQASRLVIPLGGSSGIGGSGDPVMTPDTSKVFIPVFTGLSDDNPPTGGVVDEYSTRTGRVVKAVTPRIRVAAGAGNADWALCQVLWTDASGSQVASYCASNMAPSGTGITVDDDGRMIATTLAAPVQEEDTFPSGDTTPIIASTFAW